MPNCRHARRYFVCSGQHFSAAFGRHVSKIIFERFTNEPLCSSLLLSKGDWGCRYEFRTEDANSLNPERVVIWFDGLPGSRKACLPPSCLAGPLNRFQGSKGWACPALALEPRAHPLFLEAWDDPASVLRALSSSHRALNLKSLPQRAQGFHKGNRVSALRRSTMFGTH
jgi:hypothetical protein